MRRLLRYNGAMSRLVPLLVVASLGLGATAFWQNQQLSAERQRAGALSESIGKLEAKAVELEKEAAQVRQANGIFQSESEQLRKKLASRSSDDAGAQAESASGTEKSGEPAEKKEKGGFMQAMAKMFNDPEMRKAMRVQQAMGVRMMYGDLSKELGLAPDETEQIIELLTDRQMAMARKGMEFMNGGKQDEAKQQEVGQEMDESREGYDQQIESVLGKERFAKLQSYERTMGERMAINQIDQQFTARGMALKDTQRQQLLQTMIDERLKAPPTPWDPGKKDMTAQMRAINSEETVNRMFEQQKQVNARVLDRARAFLSLDQVNALQQSQQEFLQMQQVGMKMSREMMSK